ncbi:MAG: hypothetical protein JSS56_01475 [Proteobacteria bacterium]|nr:hypothetical protein [Pseudomonadota bacterium]
MASLTSTGRLFGRMNLEEPDDEADMVLARGRCEFASDVHVFHPPAD